MTGLILAGKQGFIWSMIYESQQTPQVISWWIRKANTKHTEVWVVWYTKGLFLIKDKLMLFYSARVEEPMSFDIHSFMHRFIWSVYVYKVLRHIQYSVIRGTQTFWANDPKWTLWIFNDPRPRNFVFSSLFTATLIYGAPFMTRKEKNGHNVTKPREWIISTWNNE